MSAKVKMPEVKWLAVIVMVMSICMLGAKPVQHTVSEKSIPENVKCATALTAGNSQMREIAKEHPEIIIKASTVKMVRF